MCLIVGWGQFLVLDLTGNAKPGRQSCRNLSPASTLSQTRQYPSRTFHLDTPGSSHRGCSMSALAPREEGTA